MFILNVEEVNPIFTLVAWVGLSIGMHAFPSNQDMNNFLREIKEESSKGIIYIISLPFALLIKMANLLSIIWFDLIYAIAISFIVPMLLLR